MSYQAKLDTIVDRVENEFTSRIEDLNNSEVENVLEQLVSRFENHLNRVQAGTRGENQDEQS